MTDDQIKLAKATLALDDLLNMVTQDHTVRKSEAYVRANNVLAVLKGTTEMPEHWKDAQ